MSESSSFARELLRRRVPQLVGVYIAATWLVIELGDWVTERFGLPEQLTSFVFVAMLVLLPSVILLAYNHGAVGKDRWTRTEKIVLPLNAVLALAAVYFVNPVVQAEAATRVVQIADEQGVVQEYEVARQGYHKELIGFYWRNESGEEDIDWLSYGLPIMLSYDLNRVSPVLTAITPLDSASTISRLRSQGVPDMLDVPRGLAIEIARDRRNAAVMFGSFDAGDAGYVVDASLIDVQSGETLGEFTVTADDWMDAVDVIGAQTLVALDVAPGDNQRDDPVRQHFSDSIEAVRHFTLAQVAVGVSNDYAQGIAELQSAVEIDPAFAEARGKLAVTQHLSGNTASARDSASGALRNGYRLSDASKFVLKTNRYIFDGDYERASRVLDVWTQVQPNSSKALETMAEIAMLRGGDDGLDKAMVAYERMLELDPNNLTVLRQQAALEQQRGRYDAAADYLRRYLDEVPDSAGTYQQLSGLYQLAGDLDSAQEALENASVLADQPVASELGLARLEARRGMYEAAADRLNEFNDDELGAEQRIQVLAGQAEIALMRGRIEYALEAIEQGNEVAQDVLPPAVRLFVLENQRASMLSLLGRTDEALEAVAAVAAQLQPPLIYVLNMTYLEIYETAGNRDKYLETLDQTKAVQGQLPDVIRPFISISTARAEIWSGDNAAAIELLDTASDAIGRSYLQIMQDNLAMSLIYVDLARLYIDAGAVDKARAQLEAVLRVFPGNANAKVLMAELLGREGEPDKARSLLDEAMLVWDGADEDFIGLAKVREIAAGL